MFYIKKLIVTGDSKDASSVEFGPGLNIIHGPSNCGKSYIADCVDYMFGGKQMRIPADLGYDMITMIVSSEKGDITLRRSFDSNDIEVSSLDYRIDSGTYTAGKGSKKKLNISLLWLKLIGIMEPTKIIQTAGMKTQQLTLRTFYHMLLIDENAVFQRKSILLPTQVTGETAFKTALLYLITGNNYLPEDLGEDKKTRKIRKKAVATFIQEQLKALDERKTELSGNDYGTPEDLQVKIDSILQEIESAEGDVYQVISRIREIASEIIKVNDQLAEDANLADKYSVLRQQYSSDISRITFIAEGELHKPKVRVPVKCPFCNGDLPKKEETSCADAAKAELERLLPQIKDLENAEAELSAEQDTLRARLATLETNRTVEETRLNTELRPRLKSLRETLNEYSSALEISKETLIIAAYETRMKDRLAALDEELPVDLTFDVVAHYEDFKKQFQSILQKIMTATNFKDLKEVTFDYDIFDIYANEKSKDTYGKGYRAFLNTVVAIAVQEYLAQYGIYQPKFLLIDSPILSLKERGDESAPDSMKSSLFEYMVDHQSERQTIIIENDIPNIDYKDSTMIQFTQTEGVGRYGFLNGVK
ncbi:MAG: AAA family ATPase [Lachnospiraceae bacterium]|nr:AAA family ATPase [Lachnospiraceae bacterium]